MTTRALKLKLLTQTEVVVINTNVRTLGEFKSLNEVQDLEIDWTSSKLIDRASKTSFELDESVLPSVDSIMFIMPTKSKAGVYGYWEARGIVKGYKEDGINVPFNYTHATTEQLNKFIDSIETAREVANEIADELEDIDEENTIYLTPGVYKVIVSSNGGEVANGPAVVELTTEEDLDIEATQLSSRI